MADKPSPGKAPAPGVSPEADNEADILAQLQAEIEAEMAEERPPEGGPTYQVVSALVCLVLGLGAAVLALSYGLGSPEEPGPGMWPFIVSVIIVVLSGVLLVEGRKLHDAEAFTKTSLLPLIGLVTFVGFALLMPIIGFEIPSLLLAVIWLRFLGGETWRSTAIVATVTVAIFYFLFLYALRIPLPHIL